MSQGAQRHGEAFAIYLAGLRRTREADCLVEANLRLVVVIAKRYVRPGVSLPDLVQDGNIGLMRAAVDYDPTRGARFSTYAGLWIRKAIQTGLRRQRAGSTTLSLDYQDKDGLHLVDTIADRAPTSDSLLERKEMRSGLQQALRQLSDRERIVIRRRFPLDGGPRETLKEIAGVIGTSGETVRVVEGRALKALREHVNHLAM